MAEYKIFFKRLAVKDLDPIPKKDLQRIIKRIESLAEDPMPAGCEKLSNQDRYRIRQGNYRIVYSIQNKDLTVWVVKIGHRRDVYR
ncbi:MAG: type II toxin-antitoxin system RelE/ParE family toxin [Desulfobacterales bacterium]|nr:MAG: type II toxin-antitoxin system RelE/ParE family toxin [Desulfobacterales bacterium]